MTIDGQGAIASLKRSSIALSKPSIIAWFQLHADPHMRQSFRQNFMNETDPSGDPWAEWSDAYKARQGQFNGPGAHILRKTGGLMRSVTTKKGQIDVLADQLGGIQMTWGKNISNPKYNFHQSGTRKFPARPMIGFKQSDRIYLGQSLRGWLLSQIRWGKS